MTNQITGLDKLLNRCADGDEKAFAQLYQQTSPQVFGLLLKMVRRRELAEDLLQDTFIKVWHKARTFNFRQGRANAWLTSIARNAAIDLIRRGGRELSVEDFDDLTQWLDDGESGPEQTTSQLESAERLHHCMDHLSKPQRDGIRLSFVAGLSHGEVAKCLKAPLGTTKSWIRRGLQALRRCLGGTEISE